MRLAALLQLVFLLMTCILPDRLHIMERRSIGHCGCSITDRLNGTCCCSTSNGSCCSTETPADPTMDTVRTKTGGCANCSKAERQEAASCCSSQKSATQDATSVSQGCSCSSEPIEFALTWGPRMATPGTRQEGGTDRNSPIAITISDYRHFLDGPPTPPPKSA